MARLLILPSALGDLRALAPAARRRVVTRLTRPGTLSAEGERIAADGRARHRVAGHRVLYRRRRDGATVIVAIRPDDLD